MENIFSKKRVEELTVKELLTLLYISSFLGLPYKWGGSNPIDGFDCSGLVLEILRSQGIVRHNEDMSSQTMYEHFLLSGAEETTFPDFGDIVFFGKSKKEISHVAFMLDESRMLEAGGGDSSVTSRDKASTKNAFVKISQLSKRRDMIAILDIGKIL